MIILKTRNGRKYKHITHYKKEENGVTFLRQLVGKSEECFIPYSNIDYIKTERR